MLDRILDVLFHPLVWILATVLGLFVMGSTAHTDTGGAVLAGCAALVAQRAHVARRDRRPGTERGAAPSA